MYIFHWGLLSKQQNAVEVAPSNGTNIAHMVPDPWIILQNNIYHISLLQLQYDTIRSVVGAVLVHSRNKCDLFFVLEQQGVWAATWSWMVIDAKLIDSCHWCCEDAWMKKAYYLMWEDVDHKLKRRRRRRWRRRRRRRHNSLIWARWLNLLPGCKRCQGWLRPFRRQAFFQHWKVHRIQYPQIQLRMPPSFLSDTKWHVLQL